MAHLPEAEVYILQASQTNVVICAANIFQRRWINDRLIQTVIDLASLMRKLWRVSNPSRYSLQIVKLF